jgi:nicotinamidase-related amidase
VRRGGRSSNGAAPDRSPVALLVLDMVSDFRFPDGAAVARAALPIARRKSAVPVIYVNDSVGRWRSDFPGLVRHCRRAGSRGAPILDVLAPVPRDYAILKPRHSGFFATPLATILEYIGAKTLVLTGAAVHQCVLFTANDAYVREYRLWIPRDCVASATEAQKRLASRYFRTVLGADMRPSGKIRFPRR